MIILLLASLLSGFMGWALLESAKSAIHEIEAWLLFLITAVTLSGCIVASHVKKVETALKELSARADKLAPKDAA